MTLVRATGWDFLWSRSERDLPLNHLSGDGVARRMASDDRAARRIEVRILAGERWWVNELWVVVRCVWF